MEIFRFVRKTFALLGYMPDDDRIFRSGPCQIVVSVVILIILLAYELSCIVFFVRNLRIGEIESALFGVLEASALISAIGSFLTIVLYHKKNVRSLIGSIQKNFDKRN